jgi:hypothetical protein
MVDERDCNDDIGGGGTVETGSCLLAECRKDTENGSIRTNTASQAVETTKTKDKLRTRERM